MRRDDLTDQQDDAVTALSQNYPLTAGAGTGKTTTLSFRYLALLEDHPDALPENVLVTTFTRRAARDLTETVRERVLDRLATAGADHERWREVLDGLDEAYIHTLHAFCQRVLSEHANAVAGLDPGFDTLDDVKASRLQRDVVDELVEEEPREVELLLDAFSEYSLREVIDDLFGERPDSEAWADIWSAPARTIDEYVAYVEEELHPFPADEVDALCADEELRVLVEELRELVVELDETDPGGRTERVWTAVRLFDEPDGLDALDSVRDRRARIYDVCDELTKSGHDEYANYSPVKGDWSGSDADADRIGEIVTEIVERLDATHRSAEGDGLDITVDREGAPYFFALARLFDDAARRYEERKRDRNVLDYTDLVQRTRNLLHPERGTDAVRESLADQFDFVMIDEVQDTDPNQWDIVRSLTSLAGGETPYSAGNVFAVGDEKQSIYRFRNADVSVFQEARSALVGANGSENATTTSGGADVVGYQLQDNLRTLPPLLRFLNSLFEDVFDDDADDAFEATPQPLRPRRDNPHDVTPTTEYLLVPDDDLRTSVLDRDHPLNDAPSSARRWAEAQSVAARATRLVGDETQVYDPDPDDGPESRPVTYDDIAVIIRKRTHLDEFKRAFDDHEVPYTVVQGEGYFDTPEVRTLTNLFRVLADPRDDIRLFGLLRSPMFGFTDDELAPVVEGGDVWETLGESDDTALARTHSLLAELRTLAGASEDAVGPQVDSWAELLDVALDATGYLVSLSADERPRQALANVEQFEEYLRDAVGDAGSLRTLVTRLDERREFTNYDPEAAIPDGETGVRILTVHAAKGEEFPVVIVPGLGDKFNTDPPLAGGTEFDDVNDRPALGLSVPDSDDPFDTTDTVAKKGLRSRRLAKLRAEEKRTLYVACTRARDHLILAGTHGTEGDGDESLTELEAPETDEPERWSDFVQGSLFGDGDLLADLEAHGRATGRLHVDALTGEEEPDRDAPSYTVRLPPRPEAQARDVDVEDPPTSVEISPVRPEPVRYKLSPYQVADVLSDRQDGELVFHEGERTVRYRRGDDGTDWDEDDDVPADVQAGGSELSGRFFGEAVHRVCELQLPAERWDDVVDDALRSMDYEGAVTEDDRARVAEHARRANDYVRTVTDSDDAVYRELQAGVDLAHGTIAGIVDCLVLGDETATVVDYKTGHVDESKLQQKAEYYQPQLEAYALMVAAFDDDRPVTTRLYFTERDVDSGAEFGTGSGSGSLEELEARLDRRLCEEIEAQTEATLASETGNPSSDR
ncbi:ATP-dependent helicase/nuclease subunit A [Halogeometricum rufum]|uniref:DNA 3'-5' helicase n=1 Tax=Halogeometricum rufum TaxID=553469 RepID=A0A1I6GYR8_9EURY|nr:UvrD-helicase domain-containing protein [Halogeometricum rufum]SFR47333.1 ATP-dependent helicase/nuclease subunit A [Halogeometricum rufum]